MAVFAPFLSFFWESATEFGLDPVELFREAGIDPELRLDINARVKDSQLDRLVWTAKQKSQDDAFVFHLAQHMHPSYLGAMGYAWLTSASLRKAFERMSRYQKMLSDEIFICIADRDDALHVRFDLMTDHLLDPDLRERMLFADAVKLCRMNVGESFKPARIHFRQAEPSRPAAYYSYFRCELLFDADASMLVIDSDIADRPLSGANPQLEALLEQQIVDYLARLDKQDIVGSTKSAIFELLPSGHVSIEEIAAKLSTSVRTLRRKLKESGESFKDLLAQTRRELGERYIQDSNLSLTEVAFMLGFSDSSSFSRAYKTWTGQSPSNYRSSHRVSPQ